MKDDNEDTHERPVLVVIGGNGRIGRSVLPHLISMNFQLHFLTREDLHQMEQDSDRRKDFYDSIPSSFIILNLAGKAHMERNDSTDSLWKSNVALPLFLAELALYGNGKLIHISSVKATDTTNKSNAYALSKQCAEELLTDFSKRNRNSNIVSIRTCAVMSPPYDAGKFLPNTTVPVITPNSLAELISECAVSNRVLGHTVWEIPSSSFLTLRDVFKEISSE
jgi:nucleoside-diphosphate-sugar epimerase